MSRVNCSSMSSHKFIYMAVVSLLSSHSDPASCPCLRYIQRTIVRQRRNTATGGNLRDKCIQWHRLCDPGAVRYCFILPVSSSWVRLFVLCILRLTSSAAAACPKHLSRTSVGMKVATVLAITWSGSNSQSHAHIAHHHHFCLSLSPAAATMYMHECCKNGAAMYSPA